jgi:benzoyl-CoA reductase/2-hydroxyglutaryl-CoA dehydratase subunit BcrC/BadD/HgdB
LPDPVAVCSRSLLSSARRCLEAYWNGEMFEHIDQFEKFVENKLLENSVRKDVTKVSRRIKLTYVNKSYKYVTCDCATFPPLP